jgi:hypothetical protein
VPPFTTYIDRVLHYIQSMPRAVRASEVMENFPRVPARTLREALGYLRRQGKVIYKNRKWDIPQRVVKPGGANV